MLMLLKLFDTDRFSRKFFKGEIVTNKKDHFPTGKKRTAQFNSCGSSTAQRHLLVLTLPEHEISHFP